MGMWGISLWVAALAATLLIIQPRIFERSKLAGIFLHFGLAIPFIALASRFVVNDTTIQYVAAFGGDALPLKYRFAATWAAREGPILMWVLWLTLLAWIWRKPMTEFESNKSRELRLRLVHGFSLLLILISISLDPFRKTPEFFFGAGLNELLQTDLMVIHPPLIFLGYSFCIHLSAVSISKLFTNSDKGIKQQILAITRPGLLILTLGIGLGGLWAYLILDWGGYWAWDPVETGSLLPWLALVGISHLRTRPGKTSNEAWIGGGLVAGGLALFATLVTRAGGVWASSVHTFVTSEEGTAPSDAFSRMILLKSDSVVGVEVMSYLMIMLLLIACWVLIVRRRIFNVENQSLGIHVLSLPIVGAFLSLFLGADLYNYVPSEAFLLLIFAFIIIDFSLNTNQKIEPQGWIYFRHKYVPTLFIISLATLLLTQQAFFTLLFTLFFVPMYYSNDAAKEWVWATFGVVLCLASAWSNMIDVLTAGVLLLIFITPWLMQKEQEGEVEFSIFSKKWQQKIALWSSVMVVSSYLILTLVILIASIDTINFEAHELYGAPFILAFTVAMMFYLNRTGKPKNTVFLIIFVISVSLILSIFFPHSLGADSDASVSSVIDRGSIAWIYLPMLLVIIGPLLSEIRKRFVGNIFRSKTKLIPLSAHIVHLGLVLLIIGHVSTTLLVDRGDASHRVTLVKDEIIIHEGYGYEFNEVHITSQDLEVGDGYVGIEISVYDVSGQKIGDKIGQVEPGMLRFDKTGTARSEVDILSRWSGDIVFIFDGSQAEGLMQQTQASGQDSIELVRVTVYNLPASHLVWFGWITMMVGMAAVTYADYSKKQSLGRNEELIIEQE